MKNLYKKTESILKAIIFASILLNPTILIAEINDKKWSKQCGNNNLCYMAIKKEVKIKDSDEKQTLGLIGLQINSTIKKEMVLVDEVNKTYKQKETVQRVPVLFVNAPLNIDLTKKALIRIDDKNIINLTYTTCTNQVGCTAVAQVNDKVLDLFKSGKEVSIVLGNYTTKNNFKIEFPLKGFSKTYAKLIE